MATVTQVRAGLQTRLATISGLTAYSKIPGTVNVPAAVVDLADPVIVYDETFEQAAEMHFTILVLVQFSDDQSAQDNLDPYLDPSGASSVKAAVDGGPTLGGLVAYARVTQAGGYGTYQFNGIDYLGARFAVEVGT